MKMIGNQGPRIAGGLALLQYVAKAGQKVMIIGFFRKYFLAINSAPNDVMKRTGCVNS
jgi:hypothetical protein